MRMSASRAVPFITQTRYVLPAATREISQLLVDCLGRRAELLSLLFCDVRGGLLSLAASQQVDPTSGRLMGRALNLEALDLAHSFHLYIGMLGKFPLNTPGGSHHPDSHYRFLHVAGVGIRVRWCSTSTNSSRRPTP